MDLSNEQNGKHTDVLSLTLNDNSRDTRQGRAGGVKFSTISNRAIGGMAEFSWCNI